MTSPPASIPFSTRYQGSKLKLLPWIRQQVRGLKFDSVLDAFGGTGCVSYLFKRQGKRVTYNDCLKFNHLVGLGLIENHKARLSEADLQFVLRPDPACHYCDFIASTFSGIYFTDKENAWLDRLAQNIPRLKQRFKRALAYYALFQACLVKRPYNLFHRKNLYMRMAHVPRGFGNKATWDAPFEQHFRHFAAEANAAVFDSGATCRALCHDAARVPGRYDLVYLDPPYLSRRGVGVDYQQFYHFLEGLVDYDGWPQRIDSSRKHLPLRCPRSGWANPTRIHQAFQDLFQRYADSTIVVSYRSDGMPSERELAVMLRQVKRRVRIAHYGQYKYALSTNAASSETLLVGSD